MKSSLADRYTALTGQFGCLQFVVLWGVRRVPKKDS